jgi:hypothetical protein
MKRVLSLLLIFASVVACKKKDTTWETDWSAPIVNDTLTLANLVNDSTLSENPSGYYDVALTRTLFDLDVNEVVEIPDTTIHEAFVSSFLNLTVNPGSSFVTSSEEHDLAMEDLELKKIILKEGYIDLLVENPVGTIAHFDITLPGVTKDGVTFSNVYSAPAGTMANPGIKQATIDLSGYQLDLTGVTGSSFNKLTSQVTVTSDANGPTVNLTNLDTTIVEATFRDIKLDYAQGYFGNRILSDTVEVDLEALDVYSSGQLDLSSLSLGFEVENGIKVGAQGILHSLSNMNTTGSVVDLSGGALGSSFFIDPATGVWNSLTPSLNTIEFNAANSNIEAYLENLGVDHTVGYSIQLNPWGNTSGGWDQIFPHSKLRVNLKAQMPLIIGMNDLVLKDTFDVDLNQDPDKTRIVSGEIILKTDNAFPFSADVTLIMLDANGNPLNYIHGSEQIESAQFGTFMPEHGFNVASSEVRFVLSDEVVVDINNVKHILVSSRFNSINPATDMSEQMIIPIDAFLSVKMRTKFKSENRF